LLADKKQMQRCWDSKRSSGLHDVLASRSPAVTEVFADDKQRHEEARLPAGNASF
jgi:hypothetical protein